MKDRTSVDYKLIEKFDIDNTKPKCLVFDMDSTLAMIVPNTRSYHEYYKGDLDSPIEKYCEIARNSDLPIFICTGRAESGREATKRFLKKNNIQFVELHMKSNKDFTETYPRKRDMFEKISKTHFIECVYDDDIRVKKTCDYLGITCHHIVH